jgi:hypothetical protein
LLQEVVHGFDPDADGGQWTVLVQIPEGKMRLARTLDDLLDGPAYERVVPAFEIRQLDRDQVGVAGDKFGRP